MQHNFLYIILPLFCTTTTNVVRVVVHFFSLPLIFTLVAPSISHFLTGTTKFSCCSSSKKCLLCFLSLALVLCRPFSRWASPVCRLLSLILCLSLSLYSKFVDMTVNLSLILEKTRIQKNIRFPLLSLLTLKLSLLHKTWVAIRFPAK